jgi:hypothetical protein
MDFNSKTRIFLEYFDLLKIQQNKNLNYMYQSPKVAQSTVTAKQISNFK